MQREFAVLTEKYWKGGDMSATYWPGTFAMLVGSLCFSDFWSCVPSVAKQ